LRETACKCPWCLSIAITSENFGFYPVFEVLKIILFCGGMREKILSKKSFLIFFTRPKYFSGFFYEPPRLFLKFKKQILEIKASIPI